MSGKEAGALRALLHCSTECGLKGNIDSTALFPGVGKPGSDGRSPSPKIPQQIGSSGSGAGFHSYASAKWAKWYFPNSDLLNTMQRNELSRLLTRVRTPCTVSAWVSLSNQTIKINAKKKKKGRGGCLSRAFSWQVTENQTPNSAKKIIWSYN